MSSFSHILVTGGAGFIGSHFVRYLLQHYPKLQVFNLDSLTYAANPLTLDDLRNVAPNRYQFLKTDITSENLEDLLADKPIDAIVNFAAETHVDRSILEPKAFIKTNVLGVQNLLGIAQKRKLRFLQISTDEVYGSLLPQEPPFSETSPLCPSSPYAASKASADLLVLAAHHTYKQDVLITRCSNNFGPYQYPEKFLPLMIANALEDRPIPVYGDGKQIRDWLYVEDHCTALDRVLHFGKKGTIYNIGGAQELTNLEFLSQTLHLLGKSEKLIQFVKDRPGHDRRYGLATQKIRKDLQWEPSVSIEEGLKKTVDWYRTHPKWVHSARTGDYFKYYNANYAPKSSHPEEAKP